MPVLENADKTELEGRAYNIIDLIWQDLLEKLIIKINELNTIWCIYFNTSF
jgi:hypothetical protein